MFSPRLFYPTWINHNFWWLHPLELKLHQSTDLGLLNRFPAFQLLSTPRKRKPSAAKKIVWSSFLIIIKRFARAAGARFFCFFFGGVLDGRALVTNGVNNYISRVWNLEKKYANLSQKKQMSHLPFTHRTPPGVTEPLPRKFARFDLRRFRLQIENGANHQKLWTFIFVCFFFVFPTFLRCTVVFVFQQSAIPPTSFLFSTMRS